MDDPLPAVPHSVQRLRRLQVRCVVVGTCGGLAFLLGLSQRWIVLAWTGLLVFALALLTVLILGIACARAARRSPGT